MSIRAMNWALKLVGITPVAKLVAIRIGDCSAPDGAGAVNISALEEWCCASSDEIEDALRALADQAGAEFTIQYATIEYKLPEGARTPPQKEQQRGVSPATIYIFRGRLGIKIGITAQTVDTRLKGMRAAMLDDSISIEWSFEARESVIRRAERLAHAKLAAKLIRNEWFDVSLEDAIAAVVAAIEEARKAQK